MPTRSDAFPLLSKFYGCCIFILTCALLCTCWVVAYYFHDMSGWKIYAMPKFVEVGVLRYLRRVLRFPDATKVYPSDILESANSPRMIEIKPIIKEQTNFAVGSPRNSLEGEAEPTEKDTEIVKKQKKETESVEKVISNEEKDSDNKESIKEDENSISENEVQQRDINRKKDSEINDVKQNDENQENTDNKEKKKHKKKSKKMEVEEKSKKAQGDKEESNDPDRKEKEKRSKKEHKKRADSEGSVEKKRKPSLVEKQMDVTRRESDTRENIRKARSPSRESNTSDASKKSNNMFADRVAPGLIEKPRKEKRRKKPKKEDLGVVNLGAENEEEGNKECGNKSENDEKTKKPSDVREAPSLKDKTEETAKDTKLNANIPALAKPSIFNQKKSFNQGFDMKQESQERKKKDESIKLLKQLAEYFSDHLERKKNRYQWRQAAVVLNRLFLIILCISIAMSIIIVFLAR